MRSEFVVVDGAETHYLHAGDPAAPVLLLLHGGAFGEAAETAWSDNIDALSRSHRVIAPDWLGFGRTAKLVDFADRMGRMLAHLAGLLDRLGIERADAAALSMGGSVLLRDLTADAPLLPIRRAVLTSAGGPPIGGETRQRLMDYDGSLESMRAQVRLVFADSKWASDEGFVKARHDMAALPGSYEAFASLGVRAPGPAVDLTPDPAAGPVELAAGPAGPADPVRYERVAVPTLLIVGGRDRLKPAGYADGPAARIPGARLEVFHDCGHCPQLESADRWNAVVSGFLR